jgi:tetratricopeptide (TPR) repeat protein
MVRRSGRRPLPGGSLGGRAFLLALAGILPGCVPRAASPGGPVVSPTGYVYPIGTPPTETRFSQTATLYIRQGNLERGLELALEGIDADPENPVHFFLAGTAYARLGGHEREAVEMFEEAQRIYPAYELDVQPEEERAWAEAFNEGITAFDLGDIEKAKEAWTRATLIYDLRPDAHRNLAVLLAGEGRYDEAVDLYHRALEGLEEAPATHVLEERELGEREETRLSMEENLAQLLLYTRRYAEAEPLLRAQLDRDPDNIDLQADLASALTGLGRDGEASVLYREILSTDALESTQLFNIGVALFRAGSYVEAGDAFGRLTELQPSSRDAWFNYVNALFAAEAWDQIRDVGARLLALDPLSETAGLIVARAHLETGDEEGARDGLEDTEGAPVYVEQLQIRPAGLETTVVGRLKGNQAEPGAPLRLRFSFYGDSGLLGAETANLSAPAPSETSDFEVTFEGRATAYRYEVLP